jgi:hypothetical protein
MGCRQRKSGRLKQQAGRPQGSQERKQQHPPLNSKVKIVTVQSQRAIMALVPSAKPGVCSDEVFYAWQNTGIHHSNRAAHGEPSDSQVCIGRQSWCNRENRHSRQILPRLVLAVLARAISFSAAQCSRYQDPS